MRHKWVISFHVYHFWLMFSFWVWQVVVSKDVVAMWHDVLIIDNWWTASNLVELVESSHHEEDYKLDCHGDHVPNITFVVKESNLVSRNGLGHVLQIHHEQNCINDHENACYFNKSESSLNDLIDLGAAIQVEAAE